MEAWATVAVLVLLLMIFFTFPVFWLIVLGLTVHPGWLIVAYIWWALSDK